MDITAILNILKSLFGFLRELFIGGHFDTGGRYKLLKTCIIFIFLFSICLNFFLIKISINMSKEIIELRTIVNTKKESTNIDNTKINNDNNISIKENKNKKETNKKVKKDNKDFKLRELNNEN